MSLRRTIGAMGLLLALALPVAAQNPVSVQQLGTTTIDTNNGAVSAGTQRVTVASDSTGVIGIRQATSLGTFKTTVTTAGTAVNLAAHAATGFTIKALKANTGLIYVGDATVGATTGFQLSPGDSVSLGLSNTNKVTIDAAVNGEGVTVVWVN